EKVSFSLLLVFGNVGDEMLMMISRLSLLQKERGGGGRGRRSRASHGGLPCTISQNMIHLVW
ncbi:unnamed protein product, partial [Prunus brigantina]